jgi:hypothetical protein
VGFTLAAVSGVFIVFILLNWVSGCGEVFYRMDGSYVRGECISPGDLFTRIHSRPET